MQSSRHLSSVDRGLQGYRAGHNLASIYAELGELSKAQSLWRQVVEECPWFAPAWHGLADVLVRQDKTDEAHQCAESLRAHPEMDREAGRLRRTVLVRRGEVQTALDELNGDLEAVSTALANGGCEAPGLKQTTGGWSLSSSAGYQGAHAPRSPALLELLEERCRLLFEHFPPADAEAGFRALLEYDPQNPAGHHNLGTIQYKLGRFDEAATAYRRSIALRPQSASTHLHLGYALRDAGKLNEAIAAWKQALEVQPGEPLATAAIQDATH